MYPTDLLTCPRCICASSDQTVSWPPAARRPAAASWGYWPMRGEYYERTDQWEASIASIMTNKRSVLPEALNPADSPGDPGSPLAWLVTTLLLLKSLCILNCSEAGCLLKIKTSRKPPSGSKKDQREVETLHIFFVGWGEKQLNCQIIFAGCSSKLWAVIPMSPRLNWSSFRPTLLLQEVRPGNNEGYYNEALPAFIHNYHRAINI